jgi:hypothetical protein
VCARLTVHAPGTAVDSWRVSPETDPTWQGLMTGGFDPTPSLVPTAPIGPPLLVLSVLGSDDTPSFNPDGSRQRPLIGRCSVEADIPVSTNPAEVLVTFDSGLGPLCEISLSGPLATAPAGTTGP